MSDLKAPSWKAEREIIRFCLFNSHGVQIWWRPSTNKQMCHVWVSCLSSFSMAHVPYRKWLMWAYIYYMLAYGAVIPHKNLSHMVKDLHIDLKIIKMIACTWYLHTRSAVPKSGTLHLAWEHANSPNVHHHFVQMLHVTPESFHFILQLIENHPVFQTQSNQPQTPVQTQLTVTLYHMGCFGNGASVPDIAQTAGISEGSVEDFTNQCHVALHSQFTPCSLYPSTYWGWERERKAVDWG